MSTLVDLNYNVCVLVVYFRKTRRETWMHARFSFPVEHVTLWVLHVFSFFTVYFTFY